MVKFKSKIDNYIFETIENSIHYNILINNDEFKKIEENNNYANMKVDKLKLLANEKGVDFSSKTTKAELIKKLEEIED